MGYKSERGVRGATGMLGLGAVDDWTVTGVTKGPLTFVVPGTKQSQTVTCPPDRPFLVSIVNGLGTIAHVCMKASPRQGAVISSGFNKTTTLDQKSLLYTNYACKEIAYSVQIAPGERFSINGGPLQTNNVGGDPLLGGTPITVTIPPCGKAGQ